MKNGEEREELGFENDSIWDIIDPDIEEGYSEPIKTTTKAKAAKEEDEEEEEEEDSNPAPNPEPDDFEIPLEDLSDEDNEDEEEDEDNEGDSGDEGEEDESVAYFAKLYAEKGLLTIPEDLEIKTEEDFDKVISHTIQEGIEQYKASLGEDFAKLVEFVSQGGDIKEYSQVLSSNIPDYEVNLEEEDNQKYLYAKYLKETTKFSDSKINKLVESAEEDLELEDNALEAKEYFKAREEELKQSLLEEQEKRFVKAQEEKQEFVNKTQSIIESEAAIYDFPLGDKSKRKELSDYILKPTVPYKTPDGRKVLITQMQADKIALQADKEKQYKTFIFEALQLKNNFNFEPVKKKGVSEHTKKIKELANKHKTKSTVGRTGKSGGKNNYQSGGAFSFDVALKEL